MKIYKLIISFLLFISPFILNAQTYPDLIVLNSEDSIKCKIESIEMNFIQIETLINNQNQTVTINNTDIAYVKKGFYSKDYTYNSPKAIKKPEEDPYTFRLGLSGGLGYRIGIIPTGLDPAIEDHYQKLLTGYFIDVHGQVFFNETFGLGFRYIHNESSSSVDDVQLIFDSPDTSFYGTLTEKVTINSVGPEIVMRFKLFEYGTLLIHTGALYTDYTDEITDITNIKQSGQTISTYLLGSLDYEIQPHVIVSLHTGFNLGIINSVNYSDPFISTTYTGAGISVIRLDFGLGLNFGF